MSDSKSSSDSDSPPTYSQKRRIVCQVYVSKFKDMDNARNIILRSGTFPYYVNESKRAEQGDSKERNEIRVIVGVDSDSREYTNLAGNVNRKGETILEGVIRECSEESLGLLTLSRDRLLSSVTVYSSLQVIVFYKVSEEEAKTLLSTFKVKVKKVERSELSDLDDISWSDFWNIIAKNNETERMFRPIAMTLEDVEGLKEELVKS